MDLGAFIIPTGIGATIGGYAGDASVYARKLSKTHQLIVNPNVVNAACFSGITENMLYVEGYSLDEFFKGNLKLFPHQNNKIGVIFDKSISKEVLNVHINTINAVKTVYGIKIINYEITEEDVGINFYITENKTSSVGGIENVDTLIKAGKKLIEQGAEAIAVVCKFSEDESEDYSQGSGIDPVGGAEALISHILSKELRVPVAHAPAFEDINISTKLVSPKCAAEYITPTFLPCVLLGLANAPLINKNEGLCIDDLNFLVMPYDSLGSVPVFEAEKRNIPIYAIKENSTYLNVTADKLGLKHAIIIESYNELVEKLK